ncbi:MAG: hypothetical protein CMF96_11695 [Candidatus Marinimicrobia bacterium]|nr:hypothetical protein [Candidatus Neomarinimicrobiota bacterium]
MKINITVTKLIYILIFICTLSTIYSSYKYYVNYKKEQKVQKELDIIKRSFEIDNIHLINEEKKKSLNI